MIWFNSSLRIIGGDGSPVMFATQHWSTVVPAGFGDNVFLSGAARASLR
jgi:hypothetical protein